jgi:PAS domain S-box-containing protein
MTARQENWPPGDGEMARRIREFDWAATPLGSIDTWPECLCTAVDVCLGMQFPTSLLWGPSLILLHNDAHLAVLGRLSPHALGRPASEVLTDTWSKLEGPVTRVFATGSGVGVPDLVVQFDRGRKKSEAHLSVSFGPVHDESGQPTGVLITAIETTARVRALEAVQANEERRTFLLALHDALRPLSDPVEIQRTAMSMLAEQFDALRALYADVDADGDSVITTEGVEKNAFPIPVRHRISDFAPWMVQAFAAGDTVAVEDVESDPRIDAAGRAAYRALGTGSAVAVPLAKQGRFAGAIIVNHAHARAWPPDDLNLLEEVAERTWAAVEQAHAEKALRASEARFRSLFESMDEGYALYEILVDENGHPFDVLIHEVNSAYATLTDRTNVVGKTLKAVAADLDQEWIEAMAAVATSGVATRFERYNAQLDRWYDVYVAPAHALQGRYVSLVFNDITDRRRTDEALRQSEERYRTLFDSIDQGFCTIEVLFDDAGEPVDYRFLETNPAFARTTGLENPKGRLMRELVPDQEDQWVRIYGRVVETQEPIRFEAEAAALGRWYNVYAYPIGEPSQHRLAVLFEDITDRRRTFAALYESESRFRTIIANLPDYAIFLLDPAGKIVQWSEGAENVFGYSSEDVLGHYFGFIYPQDAVFAGEPERQLAEAARSRRGEREGWRIRNGGGQFWGHGIITAIHDEAGNLLGFTKVSRDLTEQRQARAALRASEERSRAILEEATDYAIFTLDATARVEDWFPGAEAVFGWSAAEIEGAPFDTTFTPEDRATGQPALEFEEARGHGSAPDVRWHQHKSGSRVFIEGVVRARYDLEGDFIGVIKIGRDVTERRLLQIEQAENEERRRLELEARIATATVELRSLSRRLLTVQEEERRFLATELHDEIGQILTGLALTLSANPTTGQIDDAQRIVGELTEKVRQLSMDLRPATLDAYGLLPAIQSQLERYEKRTEVMVDLRAVGVDRRFSPTVEITAYRVVQEALTNLARHAKTSAGVVQLIADDESLFISIRDDGVGLDPAGITEGTGIGGMRERVELLGGHFEIDAIPNGGTSVTAQLPVRESPTDDPGNRDESQA